jgi:hypothetical protein
MISSFRKLTSLAVTLQTRPVYFASDNWKDRDDAAEKVYISQAESRSYVICRGDDKEAFEEGLIRAGRLRIEPRIVREETFSDHAQI